uniref:Acyl_transf_3 domain-containing protein n=1 Tax=Macrostomum lignano TaxID=282301 RepID=A0A1I8F602_9PLAT
HDPEAFSGQLTVSGGAAAAAAAAACGAQAGGQLQLLLAETRQLQPVADAADGGVSRRRWRAAARAVVCRRANASLRQAALEALETFVRAEQAAASFCCRFWRNESISACANHTVHPAHGSVPRAKAGRSILDSRRQAAGSPGLWRPLWLGNYDQCMASSALRLGLCWPDSCSPAQINNLTQLLLSPLQKLLPPTGLFWCFLRLLSATSPRAQLPCWTRGCSAACSASSASSCCWAPPLTWWRTYRLSWRSLCRSRKQLLVNEDEEADAETASADGISAAAVDGGGHRVNGIANALPLRLLLCFSVLTNARKIADVSHSEGTLTCVHGLRFLSMSWVILGHTYYFAFGSLNNMGQLYAGWQNDWTFQVIANATVSVDSFFVLSGLLSHLPYVYEGPMYPQAPAAIDPQCPRTGGRMRCTSITCSPLSPAAGCMGWSWYLANDMQFYIVSPMLFCLLAIKPALGV